MSKKTKHNPDYTKNVTADVIKHGDGRAVPNEEWCKNVDITPAGNNTGWGAFLPRSGKDRPTPHTKLNECDH
jgi:hypothetical protein